MDKPLLFQKITEWFVEDPLLLGKVIAMVHKADEHTVNYICGLEEDHLQSTLVLACQSGITLQEFLEVSGDTATSPAADEEYSEILEHLERSEGLEQSDELEQSEVLEQSEEQPDAAGGQPATKSIRRPTKPPSMKTKRGQTKGTFYCQDCGKPSRYVQSMVNHMVSKKHYRNFELITNGTLICPYCKTNLGPAFFRSKHIVCQKKVMAHLLKCPLFVRSLRQHCTSPPDVPSVGLLPPGSLLRDDYWCQDCGMTFKVFARCLDHMIHFSHLSSFHSLTGGTMLCPKCSEPLGVGAGNYHSGRSHRPEHCIPLKRHASQCFWDDLQTICLNGNQGINTDLLQSSIAPNALAGAFPSGDASMIDPASYAYTLPPETAPQQPSTQYSCQNCSASFSNLTDLMTHFISSTHYDALKKAAPGLHCPQCHARVGPDYLKSNNSTALWLKNKKAILSHLERCPMLGESLAHVCAPQPASYPNVGSSPDAMPYPPDYTEILDTGAAGEGAYLSGFGIHLDTSGTSQYGHAPAMDYHTTLLAKISQPPAKRGRRFP